MSKLVKNEDAFTGLEAAIVLIAFIVVAAVFSYVMLGAGFFATGEAQRVVDTGVAQASSAVELSGPVIVTASSSGGTVANVTFILQLAAGGASVDMTKATFTVSTTDDLQTYNFTEVNSTWYAKGVAQSDKDSMLDKFETVIIDIPGNTPRSLPSINVNNRFTVEVKPDIGAALPINRMAPPDLFSKHNYEVY
jgi:flagellin FlaB